MTVDVVIVTYESRSHLPQCLDSLPQDTAATVVDNASSDGTADFAAAHGHVVIVNEQNQGFAAAANRGAQAGSADYILFLNPDASLTPSCLDLMVNAVATESELGAVGASLVRPNGEPQRSWWPYPTAAGTWAEAFGLHRLRRLESRGRGFAVGACLLVRRSAFVTVGGFDESYWLYGEEADLCCRIEKAGWRAALVQEATAIHVGGASSVNFPGLTFEHFQRGTERFIRTHRGSAALVAHRVGLLVGSALRIPFLRLSHSRGRLELRKAIAVRTVRLLVSSPTQLVTDG